MMHISCDFVISTYNTLCSRGPTKLLAECRKNACGSHFVFQNETNNIPRQDFVMMNVSCKFENSTYNTLASVVYQENLYTLLQWQRRTHAQSIVPTGCHPVDTVKSSTTSLSEFRLSQNALNIPLTFKKVRGQAILAYLDPDIVLI